MNKIYLEPIAKAQSLVAGVKAQADVLQKKGGCGTHAGALLVVGAGRRGAGCCRGGSEGGACRGT